MISYLVRSYQLAYCENFLSLWYANMAFDRIKKMDCDCIMHLVIDDRDPVLFRRYCPITS